MSGPDAGPTSVALNTQAAPDSGLACLLMLASFHGLAADAQQLQHTFGKEPFDTRTVQLAAKSLGLSARVLKQPL